MIGSERVVSYKPKGGRHTGWRRRGQQHEQPRKRSAEPASKNTEHGNKPTYTAPAKWTSGPSAHSINKTADKARSTASLTTSIGKANSSNTLKVFSTKPHKPDTGGAPSPKTSCS